MDTAFEESVDCFDGRNIFFVFIWIIWQIVSNGLDRFSTLGESSQSKEITIRNIVDHLTEPVCCKSDSSQAGPFSSIYVLTGFMTFRRRENHSWFWTTSWNLYSLTAKCWLFSSFWRGTTPHSVSLTVLANLVMWLSRSIPDAFNEERYTLSSSSNGNTSWELVSTYWAAASLARTSCSSSCPCCFAECVCFKLALYLYSKPVKHLSERL